jgi:hypothetical protein
MLREQQHLRLVAALGWFDLILAVDCSLTAFMTDAGTGGVEEASLPHFALVQGSCSPTTIGGCGEWAGYLAATGSRKKRQRLWQLAVVAQRLRRQANRVRVSALC